MLRAALLLLAVTAGACKRQVPAPISQQVRDTTWCRYTPGSIHGILAAVSGYRLPPGYNFATSQFPTLARVTFGGRWRPTEAIVRHFSDVNDTTARHLPRPKDLMQRELNFVEGGDTLWVPVEEPLIPSFSSEVRAGDSVTILVLYAGTFAASDTSQLRVLIVTEFESSAKRWLYNACQTTQRHTA